MGLNIYVKSIPFDKSLVTRALETGTDGVLVEEDRVGEVNGLGRTEVLTPAEVAVFSLTGKEVEEQAADELQKGGTVLLEQGWEVIPVENLLAVENGRLGLEVSSLEQARLAGSILERGVDFVLVQPEGLDDVQAMVRELKLNQGRVDLEKAVIDRIRQVGLGHRVCVDTCSLLQTGQGLLVGNSAAFTFFVHAETEQNPYVAARPFRINAGPVHAYVLLGGDRTCYLEELKAGDQVLIVNDQGNSSLATVGRVKIEVRPLLQIRAKTKERSGDIFLQNAETIRLVRPDGSPVSVVALDEGDEILCRSDTAGRHFGLRISEAIEEK